MKKLLILLVTGIFYCAITNAQVTTDANKTPVRLTRSIKFNFVAKDSVNLLLDDEFNMIEDSCAQVIRYAKLKMQQHKYSGKIRDVSRLDPSLVLTEGTYTDDGLKDGYFVTHYLNGKLQAKGSFKNNRYDGKWEMYYDDGKPKLFFEANGKDIKITDAWDAKGAKTIDNGKGTYRSDLGSIFWKGKLLNGRPDGTWSAVKTNDVNNELSSEKFKDGAFQKGNGPLGAYTDASRLELVAIDMLPFTHAELLRISRVPCNGNGPKRRQIVNAQYGNGGFNVFNDAIKRAVEPYLRTVNIKDYDNHFTIQGAIDEKGFMVNMNSDDSFNQTIAEGLISSLRRLPALNPATIDGKPAKQKFAITFTFEQGVYHFSYRFLAVDANQ